MIDQDSDKANLELLVNINDLELTFPKVGGTDACKLSHGSPEVLPGTWQIDGNCPIKKGETKTLKYMITVPKQIQPPEGGKVITKMIFNNFKIINPLLCGEGVIA